MSFKTHSFSPHKTGEFLQSLQGQLQFLWWHCHPRILLHTLQVFSSIDPPLPVVTNWNSDYFPVLTLAQPSHIRDPEKASLLWVRHWWHWDTILPGTKPCRKMPSLLPSGCKTSISWDGQGSSGGGAAVDTSSSSRSSAPAPPLSPILW